MCDEVNELKSEIRNPNSEIPLYSCVFVSFAVNRDRLHQPQQCLCRGLGKLGIVDVQIEFPNFDTTFHNVFSIKNPKGAMAANWGLAALVYLVVGHASASVIARMAPTGVHPAQPVV